MIETIILANDFHTIDQQYNVNATNIMHFNVQAGFQLGSVVY